MRSSQGLTSLTCNTRAVASSSDNATPMAGRVRCFSRLARVTNRTNWLTSQKNRPDARNVPVNQCSQAGRTKENTSTPAYRTRFEMA